jgi:hypothetical protein
LSGSPSNPADARRLFGARCRDAAAAFALYLALAIALTYPLVRSLSSVIPHDPGDPLLNTWLIAWNARHVPFSEAWWNGTSFYPLAGSLAFSEHVVGLVPITSPVVWLGGSAVLAYNLAFLLSFPLSGLAAYLLCRSLTGRSDAALVGGLMFGFAPYRIAHLSHVDILSWYWMPLALLGLHRYRETRRAGALVLFAASWAMQVLCKGYSLFYLSILVALWVLWFAPPWRERRSAAAVAGAWGVAALALLPVFLQYRAVHRQYDLHRTPLEIELFSADAASVLDGSPLLAHWRPLFGGDQETWLFPGIAPVLVVAAAALIAWRRRPSPVLPSRPARSVRAALAVLAAVAALVALSAVVFGPWRFALGPLRLSVSAVHKPLGLAWLFLIAVLVSSPRFVEALRRQSRFVFYAAAAVAMWLLSLGPTPRVFGERVWDKAPYWWLLGLPGFASLRVPARFWIGAVLCLTVAAALGLAFLTARWSRRRRSLAMTAVGALVLWDGWITALPLHPLPAPSHLLAEAAGDEPLLEVPGCGYEDAAVLYRALFHRRPLVNGFSGHVPPHYVVLCLGLARRDESVLAPLLARGALAVRIDHGRDADRTWRRWMEAFPGARTMGTSDTETLYLLPRSSPSSAPSSTEARLPIAAVRVNVDEPGVVSLTDGDRRSRWTTDERQRGGEKIVVDVGAVRRLDRLVLSLGPFIREFPRALQVDVSADGRSWEGAWSGPVAGLALSAALADPRNIPLSVPLGGAEGRFVRLRQTASDPLYPWSVAELEMWGRGPR